MLSEFASWYVERVGELVPARLTRGARGPVDALLADPRPGTSGSAAALSLVTRQRGRDKPFGVFEADEAGLARAGAALGGRNWPDIVLRLPRGSLLERVVTLPLAAEEGLQAVLDYEMDRYTPFTSDEIHWAATVVSREREQERIRVRILFVPRAALTVGRDLLGRLGLAPTLVEGALADGSERHLPLRAPDAAAQRRARRWLLAACALCGLLGAALAAVPFLHQAAASDAVEARITALQPAVAQAEALRQRLLAASAGSDVIAGEEARLGQPLQVISALTQLLPDDTFLNVLTLHERQLAIDGQSAAAARLIGLLSSDPVIRNAAFAAPVTRTEDGADMFSLKAEVRF